MNHGNDSCIDSFEVRYLKRNPVLIGIFTSLGIVILILDSKTALVGMQNGIDLCIRTVIPSLFPFFFFCGLLNNSLIGHSFPFLAPICRILEIPNGSAAILVTAFLGGYPAGAKAVASAQRCGQLSIHTANRMLTFCNNAGPAFLFGMVSGLFPNLSTAFILWGIHIASALMVALLQTGGTAPNDIISEPPQKEPVSAMYSAVTVTAIVCGWVILFRMILEFMEKWFLRMLPTLVQVIVYGFLELSNGCCMLDQISDPNLRFVICSAFLAWGGFCVALQTRSVTEGLSQSAYLKGKIMQTAFSLLLSASVCLGIWVPVGGLLLFLTLLMRKSQKSCGNPMPIGV